MKKVKWLTPILMVNMIFGMIACKQTGEPHQHNFGIWETTKVPTETESGQMQRECEVCGETVTKELQPVPKGFSFVKAGTFQMGCNKGYSDNKPVHEVTITKPFYMGKYEVTQAECRKYDIKGCYITTYGQGDNYPAYCISWYKVIVYCNKRSMEEELTPCYSIDGSTDPDAWGEVPIYSDDPLRDTWDAVICDWNANGYRLPTEAEWEYAARAGDNTVDSLTYSGTSNVDELGDYAWYKDNSNKKIHEVGTKKPNAFGLFDMSGNVMEWCWNWCTDKYDTEAEGGSDPTGASAGSERVQRGGGYFSDDDCAVSYRAYNDPYDGTRSPFCGFRVVRLAN